MALRGFGCGRRVEVSQSVLNQWRPNWQRIPIEAHHRPESRRPLIKGPSAVTIRRVAGGNRHRQLLQSTHVSLATARRGGSCGRQRPGLDHAVDGWAGAGDHRGLPTATTRRHQQMHLQSKDRSTGEMVIQSFFVWSIVLPSAPHCWMPDPVEEPNSFPGMMPAPRPLRFLADRL
jgi:hypothetical protein